MGFSRHEWPLMCCICFESLNTSTAVVDEDGTQWDCCSGQCAIDAGIKEIGMANGWTISDG